MATDEEKKIICEYLRSLVSEEPPPIDWRTDRALHLWYIVKPAHRGDMQQSFEFLRWILRGRSVKVLNHLRASKEPIDHEVADAIKAIASWPIPRGAIPHGMSAGWTDWLKKEQAGEIEAVPAPTATADTGEYIRDRIARTTQEFKPYFGFPITAGWDIWRHQLRGRLMKLVGGLPYERCPLNAETVKTRELDGYTREFVRFESRSGLLAVGYFLLPKGRTQPGPAILCLPGHGRGVDSIVGIAEDGSQRPFDQPDEYQADFALQCVARGYAVFALEQVSFGHRRDDRARAQGPHASSCTRDSMAALMLGETVTGWRIWDAMRAIDYLETRAEVDPNRIATMGISGGGLTSLWTAALDPRVKAAVVSGYFNTFAESILAVDHCVDNFVPKVQHVVEMPDFAGLVAPRPLFVESGAHDNIFPLPGFERAVAQARKIYQTFEVPDHFGAEVFDGDHRFHGAGAFAFLDRNL
jgi:dienelactone hydrolase